MQHLSDVTDLIPNWSCQFDAYTRVIGVVVVPGVDLHVHSLEVPSCITITDQNIVMLAGWYSFCLSLIFCYILNAQNKTCCSSIFYDKGPDVRVGNV